MKKISVLLFFILIVLKSNAQTEILVFGTAHENEASDFSKIISKIKKFKPNIVFGENLSSFDYFQLPESYSKDKPFYKTRMEYMKKHHLKKIPTKTESEIVKAEKALSKNPNLHSVRIKLTKNYLIMADRGNTEFQIWNFKTHIYKLLGPREKIKFNREFIDNDSIFAQKLYRPNSEYSKIIFPLMKELGISKIYPMDCQKYNEDWNKAWEIVDTKIQLIKKEAEKNPDSPFGLCNKRIETYFDSLSTILENSKLGWYTLMNQSRTYFEADEATNFYGGSKLYGQEAYPTEEVKKMYSYWVLRNEGMAENIIKRIESRPNQRILIAVGSSHKHILDVILAKYPKVKIIKWEEL
jgi:hypothetical protein